MCNAYASSLSLVFAAASCLHVVLLHVWLRANRFKFRYPCAAGSSVIVSGLMAFTFTYPDLAVDLAELWKYNPGGRESNRTDSISEIQSWHTGVDAFPVTLPHVDESSDEDNALAAHAMPLSGVSQTERSVATAQSESGGASFDGASHNVIPEQLPPQREERGSPKRRRLTHKQPAPLDSL